MKRPVANSAAVLALTLMAFAPGAVSAHNYTLGKIAIGHVWAKPAEHGGATAVYGPIFDQGKDPVTLKSVSTPVGRAGFGSGKEGASGQLDHIDIPAGRPLALAAWREHIRVENLARSLKAGDHFPLTMDFGTAGRITVEVEIENQSSE
ncbi:MAG: copper chaperone PCu(A)C [Flavobacteriaceae bacterium]